MSSFDGWNQNEPLFDWLKFTVLGFQRAIKTWVQLNKNASSERWHFVSSNLSAKFLNWSRKSALFYPNINKFGR